MVDEIGLGVGCAEQRCFFGCEHGVAHFHRAVPIYALTFLLPVTYFIEILRGIILRAADWIDLVPYIIGLIICCVAILTLSITRFRKQLS